MQPSGYLLAMGASNGPGQGLQGVGTPIAMDSNNPAIIDLLHEYANILTNPVFSPEDHIIHNINLLDILPNQQSPNNTTSNLLSKQRC